MTASLRILTTASLDSDPSLLIVSPDGSKTLVNCSEGCQRSFLESTHASGAGVGTLRVSSVNRVCLTHLGHGALGGLPGMILTTADVVDNLAKEMRRGNGKGNDGGNRGGRNNRNRKRKNGSLISNGDGGEGEGAPDLEIVGPEGTGPFLHSLRHFMRRDRFKVHVHEGRYDSSLNNNRASAGYAAKKKAKRRKFHDNEGIGFSVESVPVTYDAFDYPEHYDESDDAVQALPLTKQAVSYLFTTPPIPGKFLVERAQALGIPKGRLYGQLKAGKTVTFADPDTKEERTVTSEEVVAKSSPGVGVAVVCCPTLKVLSKLREADAFRRFENRSPTEDGGSEGESEESAELELDVMVHLTPKSVFRDPAYRSWLGRFGSKSKLDHVTLHAAETLEGRAAEEANSPFVSGICGGVRRSFVNDELFPRPLCAIPSDEVDGGEGNGTESKGGDEDEDDGVAFPRSDHLTTIEGCPMMDYVLMPRSRRGLNESTRKCLYSLRRVERLRKKANDSGAVERAAAIAAEFGDPGRGESNDGERNDGESAKGGPGLGELIFTGTGSAVPCKHRNVTGMYLRMDNGNSMLLDVGEGTVGQLLRSWRSTLPSSGRAPIDEYRARLAGIKAVWISHPHADHHLGLLRLLSERAAICGPGDPLVLMAPRDMFDFLAEYQSAAAPEIDGSYVPVDCRDMIHGWGNPSADRLRDDLGVTLCESVPVAHCQRSYAVVVDGTPFGRVAYSGDCRPSNRLADAARGADLLIHEATFEDGMEEDAVVKRHSTVAEAIGVASRMDARALVLTHFSQRYPRVPPLDESRRAREIPTAFAFDFMRLTPATVGLAARLTPALRLLYPGEGAEEPEGTDASRKVTAKELLAVPGAFAAKGVL